MTLGEYLRELRMEAHMTAETVAKALGHQSKQSLYNWENDTRVPPLGVLSHLCKIYGVEPDTVREALVSAYNNKLKKEGL